MFHHLVLRDEHPSMLQVRHPPSRFGSSFSMNILRYALDVPSVWTSFGTLRIFLRHLYQLNFYLVSYLPLAHSTLQPMKTWHVGNFTFSPPISLFFLIFKNWKFKKEYLSDITSWHWRLNFLYSRIYGDFQYHHCLSFFLFFKIKNFQDISKLLTFQLLLHHLESSLCLLSSKTPKNSFPVFFDFYRDGQLFSHFSWNSFCPSCSSRHPGSESSPRVRHSFRLQTWSSRAPIHQLEKWSQNPSP